jgi:hypothetical protein
MTRVNLFEWLRNAVRLMQTHPKKVDRNERMGGVGNMGGSDYIRC